MKKYFFQKFTFLSLLFLALLSCETEPIQLEIVQEEQSNVLVEEVDFNSVPELSAALNDISGKSKLARSYSEKGDSKFWMDEQNVLRLKDSVNNESYTVKIYSDDPSLTTFYNLVVTKRMDGNPIVPFVVEYNFENGDILSFAEDEEKDFDGTVNIYSLDEFASITGLNARDTQPVACFQDIGQRDNTVAGNTSFGSTGGSSGGSSTSGSTGSTGTVSVTRTHISVNTTYGTRGTVSVGQGTFYMPPLTSDKKDQKATASFSKDESNNCPEGWVSIPINEVATIPFPHCSSFEYASGLSGAIKGAAVVGVSDSFYSHQTFSDGSFKTRRITALEPLLYFSMPGNVLNGVAATLTAKAVNRANNSTQTWFAANPGATKEVLGQYWYNQIKKQMKGIGGHVSRVPSFPIKNPAPYVTHLLTTGNCS
nr:hypothetical protein [uncultured Allomuricauda sp.]